MEITLTEFRPECASCRSYTATTERLGAHVCPGCAHMIDAHGAKLHDAFTTDPCEDDAYEARVAERWDRD